MPTSGFYNPASDPPCYSPRMTRAAALALRTAGTLRENCVVVITDGPTIGPSATVTEIELNPTSPTELGQTARVHTTYDNDAWTGIYDIDLGTGTITQLTDNLGNTAKDVDAGAPTVHTQFPWGNVNWRDNYVEDSTLTGANTQVGLITGNSIRESNINFTGKTAGTWDSSIFVAATITTAASSFTVTRAKIHNSTITASAGTTTLLQDDLYVHQSTLTLGPANYTAFRGELSNHTYSNTGATGLMTVTDSVLDNITINRAAGSTGAMAIVSDSKLSGGGTYTQAAGGAAGTFGITSSEFTFSNVTQNGSGSLSFFRVKVTTSNISNTAAALRTLQIQDSDLYSFTVTQQKTLNAGFDSVNNLEGSTGTLNLLGAGGAAGTQAAIIGSEISGNSTVNITDQNTGAGAALWFSHVENQSTLNIASGGSYLNGRIGTSAVVNTGAFSHNGTIIEINGTTTLTAANVNRLRNKSFSDVI